MDTKSLVDRLFHFSTSKMSCHFLQASVLSDEKFPVDPIGDPLYMMSHCSLAGFKSLSLSFDKLIISLSMCLFVFILLGIH